MNKKLKFELINEAQKRLVEQPRDLYAHDITHLHRVAQIAQQICNNIPDIPNRDVIEVVAWWHDVDLGKELNKDKTADYLSSKELGEKERKLVLDAIKNHEFGGRPQSLEGKILFDADKVETISQERILKAREAIEAGLLDKNEAKRIIRIILNEWYPAIPKLLHFEYSKQMFNKDLPDAIKAANEILNS